MLIKNYFGVPDLGTVISNGGWQEQPWPQLMVDPYGDPKRGQ